MTTCPGGTTCATTSTGVTCKVPSADAAGASADTTGGGGSSRKVASVQVVSAFPAKIDKAGGKVTRACGAPLAGETPVVPNGLEFNVNLISTEFAPGQTPCDQDRDLQIRDGELVDGQVLTASAPNSLAPSMVSVAMGCIEARTGIGDPTGCSTSMKDTTSPASTVAFRPTAARCSPVATDTWQNVVILVDHSGSTSGQVAINAQSCLDATKFAEDVPAYTKAPEQSGKCISDKYYLRVQAAQLLIDQLNPQDRVMTMLFDEESGVKVGCTDSARCVRQDAGGATQVQSGKEDETCTDDSGCEVGDNYHCAATLSSVAPDGYDLLDPKAAMGKCFGSSSEQKAHNRFGIEARARYNGTGRAPVFEAVNTAFNFLTSKLSSSAPTNTGNAKHIVLITDGPDTCTKTENFHFSDPKAEFAGKAGQCRSECTAATTHYNELLLEMAKAGFPVHIHVIQLQSKGQTAPDPMLMELACRSDGTFQFLNQVEFVQDDPDEFYKAIGTAVSGVRHALGGSWRVGVLDNRIAIGDPSSPMPIGTTLALRGDLRFTNPLFASLAGTFNPPEGSVNWSPDFQFQQSGSNALRDRRLMFNVACGNSNDCDGSGTCGPSHCALGGSCKSAMAPDMLPCGDGGVQFCCQGTCSAKCAKCSK